MGETQVEQHVAASPSGRGITLEYRLQPAPKSSVTFRVSGGDLQTSSSTGTWNEGVLTIPAGKAGAFTITLEPKQ